MFSGFSVECYSYMSKLIIVSGVPGSGKTTFSEKIAFFYHRHVQDYRKNALNVVSSDILREEIAGSRQNHEHEEEVWEKFYRLPFEYLAKYTTNTITILDATHITIKKRLEVAQQYESVYDEVILVQFTFNTGSILEINKTRKHAIPHDVLVGFCECFEKLSEEEMSTYNYFIVTKNKYNESLFREILEI